MSTAEENENARLRRVLTQRRALLRQKQERTEVNDTETRTPAGLRRSMIQRRARLRQKQKTHTTAETNTRTTAEINGTEPRTSEASRSPR